MKALFLTGAPAAWAELLGPAPWPVLPAGNRPLLEYWFELCVELGARDVRVVLGEGAEEVEAFAGDGARWGLAVRYSFLRPDRAAHTFLRRDPALWSGGLFYASGPLFFRRHEGYSLDRWQGATLAAGGDHAAAFLTRDDAFVAAFAARGELGPHAAFGTVGLEPIRIGSVRSYFDINMLLVRGESRRYLTAGYSIRDDSYVGYDTILPPGVATTPPLIIGNECRFSPLSAIGPNAIIGNRVFVDRQSELAECLVLEGSYVGHGLEIRNKIVAGSRIIDPEDGSYLDVADSWVLSETSAWARTRDALRRVAAWPVALALTLLGAVPWLLVAGMMRMTRTGRLRWRSYLGACGRRIRIAEMELTGTDDRLPARLWRGLSLDLWPAAAAAAGGKLWLCGQAPLCSPEEEAGLGERASYYPGAYHMTAVLDAPPPAVLKRMDGYYYARHRSFFFDLRILVTVLVRRLLGLAATAAPAAPRERMEGLPPRA